MAKRVVRNLLIWMAGVVVTALLTAQQVPMYYRLHRRGTATEAVAIAYEGDNHRRVYYEFVANGRKYTGSHWGRPAKVGERISVTYLPEDPAVSCPDSPKAWLDNEAMASALAVLLIPVLAVGVIDIRLRGRTTDAVQQ